MDQLFAGAANIIQNNIFAYGRMGIFELSNPYASNSCSSSPILEFSASNNIAYFDKLHTDGFSVQKGCTYSCGFSYTQFQMMTAIFTGVSTELSPPIRKRSTFNPARLLHSVILQILRARIGTTTPSAAGREWARMRKVRPRQIRASPIQLIRRMIIRSPVHLHPALLYSIRARREGKAPFFRLLRLQLHS